MITLHYNTGFNGGNAQGDSSHTALLGFVGLCMAVTLIGGLTGTTGNESWMSRLAIRPDGLFIPVWGGLYLLTAMAGWRLWHLPETADRHGAFNLFLVQFGFNLIWSLLFFGFQSKGISFSEILMLLALIAANTALFWRMDWQTGSFFTPYLSWIGYVAVLNGAFQHLS